MVAGAPRQVCEGVHMMEKTYKGKIQSYIACCDGDCTQILPPGSPDDTHCHHAVVSTASNTVVRIADVLRRPLARRPNDEGAALVSAPPKGARSLGYRNRYCTTMTDRRSRIRWRCTKKTIHVVQRYHPPPLPSLPHTHTHTSHTSHTPHTPHTIHHTPHTPHTHLTHAHTHTRTHTHTHLTHTHTHLTHTHTHLTHLTQAP
jgi:hypothetical protein